MLSVLVRIHYASPDLTKQLPSRISVPVQAFIRISPLFIVKAPPHIMVRPCATCADRNGRGHPAFTWKNRSKAMIVKEKEGYRVKSEKGKNLGGPYKTKAEAQKRLRQ